MSKIVNPKNNTVYVCSSIYNHLDKLVNFIASNDNIFIINGNVCDQEKEEDVIKDIETLQKLKNNNHIYYVLGDRDLLYIKEKFKNLNFNSKLEWLYNQDKYCVVDFSNQTSVAIVCGGVKETLDNVENCFINSSQWHQEYNGKFGLVISNYPINKNQRKIYEYSCSIGVDRERLAIQKINSQGLKDFILI